MSSLPTRTFGLWKLPRRLSDGKNISLVISFRNNCDANQDIFLCLKERNLFLKSRLANRGPEMFSNQVSILGVHWSLDWLDLWNTTVEAELSLTLFSLPLIAHAFFTGVHRHAPVIDRPQSFPTAVLGNTFALGWSAQSLLSASEKFVTLNAIVKHVSQTLLWMRYICHLKTLLVTSRIDVGVRKQKNLKN